MSMIDRLAAFRRGTKGREGEELTGTVVVPAASVVTWAVVLFPVEVRTAVVDPAAGAVAVVVTWAALLVVPAT